MRGNRYNFLRHSFAPFSKTARIIADLLWKVKLSRSSGHVILFQSVP